MGRPIGVENCPQCGEQVLDVVPVADDWISSDVQVAPPEPPAAPSRRKVPRTLLFILAVAFFTLLGFVLLLTVAALRPNP